MITNSLKKFPLSFSTSAINPNDGTTGWKNQSIIYWTTMSLSSTNAMMLDSNLSSGFIYPKRDHIKRFGTPVRCVVNRTDTTQRDKFISLPYNFPYSGYYDRGNGVTNQDSYGFWWSRSASTWAGQAYDFSLNTDDNVRPRDYNYVGNGFAVRCVAE